MKSYHDILNHILTNGERRTNRTGIDTIGIFGYQWRHNLEDGFPLLTTKKVHYKSVFHELLWFLRGETNVKSLQASGVSIWDEWADEDGELGPVYGHQWRNFNGSGVDQIKNLVKDLRNKPESRRLIVTAWNPIDIPSMALPPCHTLWQCYVSNDNKLSLHLYARSIDTFLGLPFNIASYALLTHILSRTAQFHPGELIISFGDLHIYTNHLEQVQEQLSRNHRQLPELFLPFKEVDEYQYEDFRIQGYNPHPAIKAPVAV